MSIKDLFEKNSSYLSNKSRETIANDAESAEYLDSYDTLKERYIPPIDLSSASNLNKLTSVNSLSEPFKRTLSRLHELTSSSNI